MDKIQGSLNVVKISDTKWDVVILAEDCALQAFTSIYDNLFYIEHSVFNNEPAVIAADFANKSHAETWAEYWRVVFSDPENACKSCPTVKDFIEQIEQARQKIS